MILPLKKMYSLYLSNNAVHPASHSCPMDNSEPDARCAKTCVLLAFSGNCGMSSSASCVDCMVLLLGSTTFIPSFTALMFVNGMLVWMRLCF